MAKIFTNPKTSSTVPKRKYSRKTKTKKGGDNLIQKTLNDNFRQEGMNPEHMQIALAISKSLQDQENTELHNNTDVPSYPSSQQIKENARQTLGQFVLNKNKSKKEENVWPLKYFTELNKKKRKSKFSRVTPTLKIRTSLEREELINKKISSILTNNSLATTTNHIIRKQSIVHSNFLKEYQSIELKIFKLNNFGSDELSESFYVQKLKFEHNTTKCGCFLKKWEEIPGRELSPPREILRKVETNSSTIELEKPLRYINDIISNFRNTIVDCTNTNISLIVKDNIEVINKKPAGGNDECLYNTFTSKLLKNEEECSNENEKFAQIPEKKTLTSIFTKRIPSPDLFDSDDADGQENQYSNSPVITKFKRNIPLNLDVSEDFKSDVDDGDILDNGVCYFESFCEDEELMSQKCLKKFNFQESNINEEDDVLIIDNGITENLNLKLNNNASLKSKLNKSNDNIHRVLKTNNSLDNIDILSNKTMSFVNYKKMPFDSDDPVKTLFKTLLIDQQLHELNVHIPEYPMLGKTRSLLNNETTDKFINNINEKSICFEYNNIKYDDEINSTKLDVTPAEISRKTFNNSQTTIDMNDHNSPQKILLCNDVVEIDDDVISNYKTRTCIQSSNDSLNITQLLNSLREKKNEIIDLCQDSNDSNKSDSVENLTKDMITFKNNFYTTRSKVSERLASTSEEFGHVEYSTYNQLSAYESTPNNQIILTKGLASCNSIDQVENKFKRNDSMDSNVSQESCVISDEELHYSSSFYTPNNLKQKHCQSESVDNDNEIINLNDSDENSLPIAKSPSNEFAYKAYNPNDFENVKVNSLLNVDKMICDSGCDFIEIPNKDRNGVSRNAYSKVIHPRITDLSTRKSYGFNDTFGNLLEQSNFVKQIEKQLDQRETTPTKTKTTIEHTTPDNGMIVKTSDVTPMPDYESMRTPDIVQELNKFGLKKLKRQRGISMLKYLYDSTHPSLNNQDEKDAENRNVKRRRLIIKDNFSPEEHKAIEIKNDINYGESLENMIFERKVSKKIASCQVPMHIAFHNLLASDPHLHENILLYEPLEVEVLYDLLKKQGFKYHMQDLITFLDRKCITFLLNQANK